MDSWRLRCSGRKGFKATSSQPRSHVWPHSVPLSFTPLQTSSVDDWNRWSEPANAARWLVESLSRDKMLQSDWLKAAAPQTVSLYYWQSTLQNQIPFRNRTCKCWLSAYHVGNKFTINVMNFLIFLLFNFTITPFSFKIIAIDDFPVLANTNRTVVENVSESFIFLTTHLQF